MSIRNNLRTSDTPIPPSELEDVQGYLRGKELVYVRHFVDGTPIEDLAISETGSVLRGPVAYPPRFPRPRYTETTIQANTFNALSDQIKEWCEDSIQPAINKNQSYFSIGIRCGVLRTMLIKVSEADAPRVVHDILQEVPSP